MNEFQKGDRVTWVRGGGYGTSTGWVVDKADGNLVRIIHNWWDGKAMKHRVTTRHARPDQLRKELF